MNPLSVIYQYLFYGVYNTVLGVPMQRTAFEINLLDITFKYWAEGISGLDSGMSACLSQKIPGKFLGVFAEYGLDTTFLMYEDSTAAMDCLGIYNYANLFTMLYRKIKSTGDEIYIA